MKKLHEMEEAVYKRDISKMRDYIKVINEGLKKDDLDSRAVFDKLSEKEYRNLREWPSLILKADYIASKRAQEHLEASERDFWSIMYEKCAGVYLLARQGRSMGACVEALKLMMTCAVQVHSLGGDTESLDTDMVFKKGWQSEKSGGSIEGGIEL